MTGWMLMYVLFIVIGGIYSIVHYRQRGSWFIIGESFSLLFTVILILYYYHLYPKPDSVLVPLGMFLYIIYWEFIGNKELILDELRKEQITKNEGLAMIALFILLLSPLFYVSGKLISSY